MRREIPISCLGLGCCVGLLLVSTATASGSDPLVLERKDGVPSELFGYSMAWTGDRLIVGGGRNEEQDFAEATLWDVNTGALIATLGSPEGETGLTLGWSVAAGGGLVAVHWARGQLGQGQDGIWIFDAADGSHVGTISPVDTEQLGIWWEHLSMNDSGLLAVTQIDTSKFDVGVLDSSVRLFDTISRREVARVGSDVVPDRVVLGRETALTSDRLVYSVGPIGLPSGETQAGFALLFDITDPGDPSLIRVLEASQLGNAFGSRVEMDEQFVAMSMIESDGTNTEPLVVFFDLDTGDEVGSWNAARDHEYSTTRSFPAYTIDDGILVFPDYADSAFADRVVYDIAGRRIMGYVEAPEGSVGNSGFGLGAELSGKSVAISSAIGGDAGLGSVYLFTDVVPCPADFAEPLNVLDFDDVSAFVGAFLAQDERADFAEPIGVYNFFDLGEYLRTFANGCD